MVFDEFYGLFRRNYQALEEALELLDSHPPVSELVLTGRHAPAKLIERADLVTSMDAVRHPYETGDRRTLWD